MLSLLAIAGATQASAQSPPPAAPPARRPPRPAAAACQGEPCGLLVGTVSVDLICRARTQDVVTSERCMELP